MGKEAVSEIRLALFKHSEHSFLAALDEAGISHGVFKCFLRNIKQQESYKAFRLFQM
jgi:hypothetical protein